MANEFVGSSLIVVWTTSSGTTTLSTDFRNFAYTPSIAWVDVTAGADTAIQRVQSFKDGNVSMEVLMLSNVGTGMIAQLAEGQIGTLTWGEAGTAAGMPKVTLPAISEGFARTSPYNDVVTMSPAFIQNGPRVDGTY